MRKREALLLDEDLGAAMRAFHGEVFNLVVKNGRNRRESIDELATSHKLDGKAASDLYFGHRKKNLKFLPSPINTGV